jgi:hypothetical protein
VGTVALTAVFTFLSVKNPHLERSAAEPVKAKPSIVAHDKAPLLWADRREIQFDNVAQGATGEAAFQIRNDGKSTLVLEGAKSSCKCTGVRFEKDKLEPGEATRFIMSYDVKAVLGKLDVLGTVKSNDPAHPETVFQIKLDIVREVFCPESVDFGTLFEGSAVDPRTFFIYSKLSDKLVASEPKFLTACLKATLRPMTPEELKQNGAKGGTAVTLSNDGAFPVGYFQDTMTVKTGNDRVPVITVPIVAQVQGNVSVEPEDHLNFGNVAVGKAHEIKRRVFIKGLKPGDALKVGRVTVDEAKVEITADPKIRTLFHLKASIPSTLEQTSFKGSVELVDSSGKSRVMIPIQGIVGNVVISAGY